jgi:hypothetical protein
MSASGTHVDVNDACATRLLSRVRVECGRVESNHHSHWRRGYSALSSPMLGVRGIGRPVGLEPTLRGSQPRMLAVTSRPPRRQRRGSWGKPWGSPDGRNGRRDWLPATGGRDVARSNGSGAGCFTFQQSCQRDYHAATPSPVGPGGLSAQPHVGARALRSPVPSLPRPARRRVDPSKMARVGFEPTVSSS